MPQLSQKHRQQTTICNQGWTLNCESLLVWFSWHPNLVFWLNLTLLHHSTSVTHQARLEGRVVTWWNCETKTFPVASQTSASFPLLDNRLLFLHLLADMLSTMTAYFCRNLVKSFFIPLLRNTWVIVSPNQTLPTNAQNGSKNGTQPLTFCNNLPTPFPEKPKFCLKPLLCLLSTKMLVLEKVLALEKSGHNRKDFCLEELEGNGKQRERLGLWVRCPGFAESRWRSWRGECVHVLLPPFLFFAAGLWQESQKCDDASIVFVCCKALWYSSQRFEEEAGEQQASTSIKKQRPQAEFCLIICKWNVIFVNKPWLKPSMRSLGPEAAFATEWQHLRENIPSCWFKCKILHSLLYALILWT